MNTIIWILQGLLAMVFLSSGCIILLLPKEKLVPRLSWVSEYSYQARLFICISKMLGALGLVLPGYLHILPGLAIVAAFGLATIMVLAFIYHFRKREFKNLPATVLFFTLSLLIAIYRWWSGV